MKKLIVVVAVALSACAGREVQISKLDGSATSGASLFNDTCASCHGTDGKGTQSGVDLHEPAKNDSKEEVVSTILNGRSGTSMVSFANSYTDQQIADLYAYMKTSFGN